MIHFGKPPIDRTLRSDVRSSTFSDSRTSDYMISAPVAIDDRDQSRPVGNSVPLETDAKADGHTNAFADPTFYLAAIVAIYLLITVPTVGLAMFLRAKIESILKLFEH